MFNNLNAFYFCLIKYLENDDNFIYRLILWPNNMNIKEPINPYRRKWSNISLLYHIGQMKKNKDVIHETRRTQLRRSEYFFVQQPPGNAQVFNPDSFYKEC